MSKVNKLLKTKKQIFKRIQKNPGLIFVGKFIREYPEARIYLVGGAVRDAILDKEIKDWDFLITGLGVRKIEKFLKKYGSVKLTDTRAFGVFKFFPRLHEKNSEVEGRRIPLFRESSQSPSARLRSLSQAKPSCSRTTWAKQGISLAMTEKKRDLQEIDIALPRKETYEKGKRKKHAKVKFDPKLPIEEDLARRDFTINAVALGLQATSYPGLAPRSGAGKLQANGFIDPFGGIKDLKNKTIRAVGNSEDRFQEDPSRILRALRFAVQLNFKIESKTWRSLKKLMPEINKWFIESWLAPSPRTRGERKQRVAREIIAEEFLKAFSIDPNKTLDFYDQGGALKELMPEVEELKKVEQGTKWHSEGDVYTHTRLALGVLSSSWRPRAEPRPKGGVKQGANRIPRLSGSRINHDYRNNHRILSIAPSHFFWSLEVAPSRMTEKNDDKKVALKVALLFHDLGKKETQIKKSKQKITFHGHDVAGIEKAGKIIKRLRLDSLDKKSPYYLDPKKVKWLIRHHMLIINTEPEKIKENTLEKYFFREDRWGDDLLKLVLADAKACKPSSGKLNLTKYWGILEKIRKLEKKHRMDKKRILPPPLLNGRGIMKALNLPPGPLIGKIKEELRIWQLKGKMGSKKEALGRLGEISTVILERSDSERIRQLAEKRGGTKR